MQPVLIIHGGAGRKFKNEKIVREIRKKIAAIIMPAYQKLLTTNSAIDAVTYAVQLLEDDPYFNAGTGSLLQADGKARLSASVMDGFCERFAAVINLEKIKNPVLVARALIREKDRVLTLPGALKFAKQLGLKIQDPRTPESIQRWKKSREHGFDTVGACAVDWKGHLASATSTGGRGFEKPGRVSDSAMPVANFADSHCAISATGIGEEIIDQGLALKIGTRVRDGMSLRQAFEKTFHEVRKRNHQMGAIGVDTKGNVMKLKTTESLIWGWQKGKKVELF